MQILRLSDTPPTRATGNCFSCGEAIPKTNSNQFYHERERCRIRAWLRYNAGWPPLRERITPS